MATKRGRPEKENLLEGFENLDTGEPATEHTSPYFPSMRAASNTLGIDMAILKYARQHDCPAFRSGGHVHREQLVRWLKENPIPDDDEDGTAFDEELSAEELPDETGGVGQTLQSLQAYERRLKNKVYEIEKKRMNPILKADLLKAAQDAWIKVSNTLLKYDLSVALAKRESGELIPLADAAKGVQGLLAWHTVAMSDALRNIIPELEGKNKYQIAQMLDGAIRSSIYRNFKLGVKLNKIPEWMYVTATSHVRDEKPLSDCLNEQITMENF